MIRKITVAGVKLTLLSLMLVTTLSCAKKTIINVDYRLPDAAKTMAGKAVYIESRDLRSDTEIFNQRAQEEFEAFTGLFSLSTVTPDGRFAVVGNYPLPQLFEAAMKQRLVRMGIAVSDEPSVATPLFRIDIQRFRIERVGQKWMADIGYEVSLTRDQRQIARERVAGSAERLQVMGSAGAEKVIGEIFSEMMNRLDVERLFAQAKL